MGLLRFSISANRNNLGGVIDTPGSAEARWRVPLRWRDLDHQGHVYHATLLTLLDEARTRWLADELGVLVPDSYVVVRMEIDFRAELTRGDESLDVSFRIEKLGNSSLALTESAWACVSGALVIEAKTTIVMWDRAASRRRMITDEERARAARIVAAATRGTDAVGAAGCPSV